MVWFDQHALCVGYIFTAIFNRVLNAAHLFLRLLNSIASGHPHLPRPKYMKV